MPSPTASRRQTQLPHDRPRRVPSRVRSQTPGVDADDSWRQIVAATWVTPNESGRQARSAEAVRRLLALPEGERLVNSLWRDGRPTPTAAPRYGVNVAFVDNIPAAVGGGFE